MSEKAPSEPECEDEDEDDDDGGAGCLIFFGLIIASLAMGAALSEPYGWLTLGLGLLLIGLLSCYRR